MTMIRPSPPNNPIGNEALFEALSAFALSRRQGKLHWTMVGERATVDHLLARMLVAYEDGLYSLTELGTLELQRLHQWHIVHHPDGSLLPQPDAQG
jgi:hypothetical protein